MAPASIAILMADYGHDPTETTIPYLAFKEAGFDVHFVTEQGKSPASDKVMLEGLGQKILGATQSVVKSYSKMIESEEWKKPLSWSSPSFSLDSYSLVFLPGGHDKAVRQIMDSEKVHSLLADFFPKTLRSDNTKVIAAVCHGVLPLSKAKGRDGRSVLYECTTTTLPARFEQVAYWGTRAFLGDYYKTYGAGTEDLEESIKKCLKDPNTQYKVSLGLSPFVVEDKQYNYISARFPGDCEEFARKIVSTVKNLKSVA